MKKRAAQLIWGIGLGMVIFGLWSITQIFEYTYEVNSRPDPPVTVIVFHDAYLCGCDISNGLAWNTAGVIVSVGAIMVVVGVAKERLITRRGY